MKQKQYLHKFCTDVQLQQCNWMARYITWLEMLAPPLICTGWLYIGVAIGLCNGGRFISQICQIQCYIQLRERKGGKEREGERREGERGRGEGEGEGERSGSWSYDFFFLFCAQKHHRDNSIPDLENVLDDSNRAAHESTARLMAEQVSQLWICSHYCNSNHTIQRYRHCHGDYLASLLVRD